MANRIRQAIQANFVENGLVDTRVPRGTLFDMIMVVLKWTSTVATDATSVRTRGAPIKWLQFIGDGGKIHLSIKLQDAVRKAEIYGRASLAQILSSPSGVTAAGGPYTGYLRLPLYFSQRFANAGWLTALASWRLAADPVVRIQFGSHAEVFVGGTGSTAVSAGDFTLQLTSLDNFDIGEMQPNEFADHLGIATDRYVEVTYTAANDKLKVDLETTSDIRAVMITGEDTNGVPLSDAELAKITVSMIENGNVRVQDSVNLGALRAENSEIYGFSNGLPAGTCILEYADDKDIVAIYPATKKNSVSLLFNVATPASGTYTLRIHTIGIEPGRAARAA